MANFVNIIPDHRQLDHLQRTLADYPKGYQKVTARAINKISKSVRKDIVNRVQKDISVADGVLKRRNITLRKANFSKLEALIRIKGGRIRLIDFKAKQIKKGVSYRISPSGKRKTIRSGFIAVMGSGHRGVFQRTSGNDSLPIQELRGPSVPQVFSDIQEFANGLLERAVEGKLQRELETQLGVFMEQAG